MSRPPTLLLALVLALPCAAPAANAPAPGLPHFDVRRNSAAAEVVLAVPDGRVFISGSIQDVLLATDRARLPLIGFSPADLRVPRSLDVQLEEAAILKERLAALEHRP